MREKYGFAELILARGVGEVLIQTSARKSRCKRVSDPRQRSCGRCERCHPVALAQKRQGKSCGPEWPGPSHAVPQRRRAAESFPNLSGDVACFVGYGQVLPA